MKQPICLKPFFFYAGFSLFVFSANAQLASTTQVSVFNSEPSKSTLAHSEAGEFTHEWTQLFGSGKYVAGFNEQTTRGLNASSVQLGMKPPWQRKPLHQSRLEFVIDLFDASAPNGRELIAIVPMIRYNFSSPKAKLSPFIEIGTGVSYSDIGDPDLQTRFNFASNIGVGVRYQIHRNQSLVIQYRYQHVSNAGTNMPNRGLNNAFFFIGISKLVK